MIAHNVFFIKTRVKPYMCLLNNAIKHDNIQRMKEGKAGFEQLLSVMPEEWEQKTKISVYIRLTA
jgi:hypothetical protein